MASGAAAGSCSVLFSSDASGSTVRVKTQYAALPCSPLPHHRCPGQVHLPFILVSILGSPVAVNLSLCH